MLQSNCIIIISKCRVEHSTKKDLPSNLMLTRIIIVKDCSKEIFNDFMITVSRKIWKNNFEVCQRRVWWNWTIKPHEEKAQIYLGWWPLGFWACICMKYLLLNVVPSPTLVARGNVLVDPLDLAESESDICTPVLPPLSVLSLRKLSLWVLKPLKEQIKLSVMPS